MRSTSEIATASEQIRHAAFQANLLALNASLEAFGPTYFDRDYVNAAAELSQVVMQITGGAMNETMRTGLLPANTINGEAPE